MKTKTLNELKSDLNRFEPQKDNYDIYFEDEHGNIHKINSVCVASRVAFETLGSDSQTQILIQ